jgi:hypothetical protein
MGYGNIEPPTLRRVGQKVASLPNSPFDRRSKMESSLDIVKDLLDCDPLIILVITRLWGSPAKKGESEMESNTYYCFLGVDM